MYIGRHWKKYLLIFSLIIVLISIDCRTRLEQNTQVLFCFHKAENVRQCFFGDRTIDTAGTFFQADQKQL